MQPEIENLDQFEGRYVKLTYVDGSTEEGKLVAVSSYSEFPVTGVETEHYWGRWVDLMGEDLPEENLRIFVYQDTEIEEAECSSL